MGWVIRLCGPMGVERDGRALGAALPGRQGRLLFAYLLLNRDRDCGRARADRPAVARAAARRRRHRAQRAALQAAQGARRGSARRPLGAALHPGRGHRRRPRARGPRRRPRRERGRRARLGRGRRERPRRARRRPADLPPRLRRPVVERAAARAGEHPAARARGARRVLPAPGRPRARRRRAGRARGDRRRAVPRVRAPAADGGPRGGRQPGRGTARVRGAADPAARRARDHARAGGDDRARPRAARRGAGRAASRPPAPRRSRSPPGRRRSPPRSSATRWSAARASSTSSRRRGRESVTGTRRLVLVAGDAGIGKTRLAAEIGRRAYDDGALVLYGRFDEEALAPYQAIVEMVRGWSSGASLEPLRERVGVRAADLGILFGEFGAPPLEEREPGPHGHDADARRLRLFDAVAALLGEIGTSAPLVLVFDDLHWADRPTLQLLKHLVRSPQPRRVLLLGTYRDAELDPGHPLLELLDRRAAGEPVAARRARRPRRAGGRRAGGRPRRAVGRADVRARPARRDRGQPVLHRGGRPPPA